MDHPLFTRLWAPLPPPQSEAVALMTNAFQSLRGSVGMVYLATQASPPLRRWLSELRKLRMDSPGEDDPRCAVLDGSAIKAKRMASLGRWSRYGMDEKFECEIKDLAECDVVMATAPYAIVTVDKKTQRAVGYATFSLSWEVSRRPRKQSVRLGVEIDQVWLAPRFRGRGWAAAAAHAIAMTARVHVNQLDLSAAWPPTFCSALDITVGADVISQKGGAFVEGCGSLVENEFNEDPSPRFEHRIDVEVRW